MKMKKIEIRKAMIHGRNNISFAVRQKASVEIKERLCSFPFTEPLVLASYWPIKNELDPRPAMVELSKKGVSIALPVIVETDSILRFRRWTPDTKMVKGAFSIPVPSENEQWVVPHVVLVPLVGIDQQGFRLGYGGGYYDRTLISLMQNNPSLLSIGLAYEQQFVGRLPREEWDQPLNLLMMPHETKMFHRSFS